VLTASNIGMSIYKTHAANATAGAPVVEPASEDHKMDTMMYSQPVVQDPRYGGPQMA
jgi:hypothetical protein